MSDGSHHPPRYSVHSIQRTRRVVELHNAAVTRIGEIEIKAIEVTQLPCEGLCYSTDVFSVYTHQRRADHSICFAACGKVLSSHTAYKCPLGMPH